MTQSDPGQLLVGAAKVDITTPEDALPPGYNSIHDHLYARAIVLDNQSARAVLLGADLGMFTEDSYSELAQQIVEEVGCPIENILMSGTHTHGSPSPGAKPVPGRTSNVLDSFDVPYAQWIKRHVFEAVREANARLQPARVGHGTGQPHVNVNRDAVHPKTRKWYQGPNPDGPSDKTVAVVKFETLSGELYNIVAQRLKELAPYGKTVVVPIANGKSVGYIPDDASYERHTFQVLGCRIKKGYAERAILDTALDMMDQSIS